jgi:type 2A phosphatase activator TIP41
MFATPAPSRNAGKSLSHLGWEISTTKLPICAAPEIDAMTVSLGIAPPEMIFGNNLISLHHKASGWGIKFNSYDALDLVDKTGETMLKVAYSEEWGRSRKEMVHGEKESELGGKVRDVAKKWDWSYSTEYKGTMVGGEGVPKWEKGGQLPLELLKRPDPILLFDEVVLYEDELADNGIAILSIKLRVMPERLLLLQRFFLRLDGVVVRVRDTRVYVEFKTGEVVREYVNKEMEYGKLREVRIASGASGMSPVILAILKSLKILGSFRIHERGFPDPGGSVEDDDQDKG